MATGTPISGPRSVPGQQPVGRGGFGARRLGATC